MVPSYYDVLFRTGTTANINKIEVTFPAGTNIGSVRILEVSGIPAGGGVSKSGQTVTYTIPSSPLVPSNTVIRMGYANIINPTTPGSSFSVQIATKTSGGSVIDSGTSVSYAMKQIGTTDIADNAITSPRIAPGAIQPQTTIRNSLSVAVEPGATNGVNVPCDPNEIITGGGFSANSGNGNIQVIDSAPFEGGWNVDVLNNGLVSESFIGYAECLRLVP